MIPEYIITKNKIREITDYAINPFYLEDHPDLWDEVRSRPYQCNQPCEECEHLAAAIVKRKEERASERNKMLDELRIKYLEFLNHPCPELADKYKHCCDAEWCGLCILDEVLEELRSKQEREQG